MICPGIGTVVYVRNNSGDILIFRELLKVHDSVAVMMYNKEDKKVNGWSGDPELHRSVFTDERLHNMK